MSGRLPLDQGTRSCFARSTWKDGLAVEQLLSVQLPIFPSEGSPCRELGNMKQLRYSLYRAVIRLLPKRAVRQIGALSVLRPLRDRLFRPSGAPDIVSGTVSFEGMAFYFAAPFQTFYRAERHGVERRICRLVMAVLEEGATAIDVGANYGFITLVMGKQVGATGRVLSFEINPAIHPVLRQSVERNGLSDTTAIMPQGAGAAETGGLVTVDGVLEQERVSRVDAIKIDVDGGDLEVLRGAENTLRSHHPVVIVEMAEKHQAIYDFLVEVGYTHFIGMSNEAVEPGIWPPNLIASVKPVSIPEPGSFAPYS